MPGLLTAMRRTSLVVSGVVSLVAALLLAERIIRPGIIEEFGTVALVGLLMLFLLPAATVLALRHDRRQALMEIGRQRADAAARLIREAEHAATPMHAAVEPMVSHEQRSIRHGAHGRSAGRTAEGPAMSADAGERSRAHESVA